MLKIPVWLDCDPGNDDVFAILIGAYHPRYNLLGISTVHGNAPLLATTRNALVALDVIHYDVPVYPGLDRPIVNPAKFALDIHGDDGLGGVELPETTVHQAEPADAWLPAMKAAIDKYEGEICICVTGTMSNLAVLLQKHPECLNKIKYVAIMGGAIDCGNRTKWAEFNFYADPHAANYCLGVLGNKAIISLLNVTLLANATEEIRKRMLGSGLKGREWFYNIAMFYNELYIKVHGITLGPPVHDPVAMYSLLPFVDEDLPAYGFDGIRRKCTVVEDGEKAGMMVPEAAEDADGAYIPLKFDAGRFWNELLDCMDAAKL